MRIWIGECKLRDQGQIERRLHKYGDCLTNFINKLNNLKHKYKIDGFEIEWQPIVISNAIAPDRDVNQMFIDNQITYYHAILSEHWGETFNWEINELRKL
jgi:hypothetical protein